jgi:hypothetical protein
VIATHSSHNDPMDGVDLVQFLERQAVVVLESLAFVDNQNLPTRLVLEDSCKVGSLAERFVGSDEDVERPELIIDNAGSRTSVAEERHNAQIWRPTLKLSHPVPDGGVGYNDQRRVGVPFGDDRSEEGRDLDGFALTIDASETSK